MILGLDSTSTPDCFWCAGAFYFQLVGDLVIGEDLHSSPLPPSSRVIGEGKATFHQAIPLPSRPIRHEKYF